MNIYITDKNETREIQLKSWDGSNWSPDCFADIADSLPTDYPISYDDSVEHDASAAMTDEEYRAEVAWWEKEIAKYNDHDEGSWFVENNPDPDEEFARGLEYQLFAD